MQYWSFETRGPQTPKTLADCPENVPVLVGLAGGNTTYIRARQGDTGHTVDRKLQPLHPLAFAVEYVFICYVNPPDVVLPSILSQGEPYRLYEIDGLSGWYWIDEHGNSWHLTLRGAVRSAIAATDFSGLSHTNIFAVLKTLD